MPFDGKTYQPPQHAVQIERLMILKDLLRGQTDHDQHSYSTCLWGEAKWDKRLRRMGLRLDWLQGIGLRLWPNGKQKRFFGMDVPIFGTAPVRVKRAWIEDEIARLRKKDDATA